MEFNDSSSPFGPQSESGTVIGLIRREIWGINTISQWNRNRHRVDINRVWDVSYYR